MGLPKWWNVCDVDYTKHLLFLKHAMFQKSNLDQVSLWLPYLKQLKPMVQILVCEECTDDDGNNSYCTCEFYDFANPFLVMAQNIGRYSILW